MLKSDSNAIFGSVKRILAITFILLLSAQTIFKIGIISFFQANRDYIATVLCVNKEKPITMCNGQCFLDRNLALADEERPEQAPTNNKIQVETSVFIATDVTMDLTLQRLEIEPANAPQTLYHFSSDVSIFHPPC